MSTALVSGHDLVIFDLDGVLILGDRPVPGAGEAVTRLRALPVPVVFATNNASRSPEVVADLLSGIGIPATAGEVSTSARAAASLLAARYPAESPVLVIGAPSLAADVRRAGLRPVTTAEQQPVAVVQGYGPEVGWAALAEASVAIRAGADWVATNADRTLPSPRGPLPGNGSLVAALATALGRQPDTIVGKPDPGLFAGAARDHGAQRPLVVGDRLDTDIEGARRAGMDSLLVLTGVSRPAELLDAPVNHRPTYLAADLGGLFTPAVPLAGPQPQGWRVSVDGPQLVLHTVDGAAGTGLQAVAALCATSWARPDGNGAGPRPRTTVAAGDGPARVVLQQLGLIPA